MTEAALHTPDSALSLGRLFEPALARAAASVVGLGSPRGGATSGTVWATTDTDALVVTSHRGTAGRRSREASWTLTSPDQSQREVELVGRDPGTDIAVFRTKAEGLTAIERSAELPTLGTLALALGRPGWQLRASMRILGLVGPGFRTPQGGRIDAWLESDRALPPGFGGGPLIDVAGRMLGLGSRALVRGADLAIPTRTVERVVAELVDHGEVRHGWLGVSLVPIVLPTTLREMLGLERRSASLVAGLEDESPAAAAGLLVGDVVLELGGKPADDPSALREILIGQSGQELELVVVRAGSRTTLRVTPS